MRRAAGRGDDRNVIRALGLVVALLFVSMDGSPQAINPNNYSSRSDLVVRVRLRSEKPPAKPIEVELCTLDGVARFETFTHGDGRADFHDVVEGKYRIRVQGAGYVTYLSEPFEILHNEHSHAEVAYISELPAKDAATSPPTISMYDLNVPDKAKAQLEKAEKAFAAGNVDESVLAIRKAIQIYPPYARAYNDLGVVLMSKGDTGGAKQAFEQSLKINSRFEPAMVNLARLQLKSQDLQAAAETIQNAVDIEPEDLGALAILANVQFFQGKFDAALGTVSQVHTVPHSNYVDVHLIAAEIYQKQGRNPEALNECRLFLAEAPKSPRVEQVRKAMAVIEARK